MTPSHTHTQTPNFHPLVMLAAALLRLLEGEMGNGPGIFLLSPHKFITKTLSAYLWCYLYGNGKDYYDSIITIGRH